MGKFLRPVNPADLSRNGDSPRPRHERGYGRIGGNGGAPATCAKRVAYPRGIRVADVGDIGGDAILL